MYILGSATFLILIFLVAARSGPIVAYVMAGLSALGAAYCAVGAGLADEARYAAVLTLVFLCVGLVVSWPNRARRDSAYPAR